MHSVQINSKSGDFNGKHKHLDGTSIEKTNNFFHLAFNIEKHKAQQQQTTVQQVYYTD